MNNNSGIDLARAFADPPARYRPLQIIHNFDSFGRDEATLRQRMQWLKDAGIGGLVCNVSFNDYMRSEEQWRIFVTGLKVAEELGLHLWLYDEDGYPSGAAGGLVLERDPNVEAVGLVRRVDADGKPRYELQRMYEGTHCTENVYRKRRYVNLLNPKATRLFIQVTHEAYARRVPNLGKRFHAIFTDEPSLMTTYIRPSEGALPALPWMDDLPAQFRRRKGYDLMPHLESLYTDTGDHHGVRCDYYDVVAQLVAERYFGQIQQWCRRHGIASSGHLLAEEKLLWHVMYYGDMFPCLRRMDIPGIDILSSDPLALAAGNGFLVPKLISSAAHLMGRTQTMSETSDFVEQMAGKRAALPAMTATAALQYLLGINIITSYYPDPYGATHPNNTEQRRAEYVHYCAFVGRLSAMLRSAQHLCDVAVLYPIAGVQANFFPTALSMYQPHPSRRLNEIDDGFVQLCRRLLQSHIDYDIVDEPAVQQARVEQGALRIGKERYRVLVVPSTDALHVATLRAVENLKRKGVRVLFVGLAPRYSASRRESDAEVQRRMEQFLRSPDGHAPTDEAAIRLLKEARYAIALEPDVPQVWAARYRRDESLLIFLVNLSLSDQEVTVRMPSGYRASQLWLPETGAIRQVQGDAVKVRLERLESAFVWCIP